MATKITNAQLLAQVAAMQCTIDALRNDLAQSEDRRKYEGAAYRARIAQGATPSPVKSAFERCKQLNAEGIACYVKGGQVYAARTHDAL